MLLDGYVNDGIIKDLVKLVDSRPFLQLRETIKIDDLDETEKEFYKLAEQLLQTCEAMMARTVKNVFNVYGRKTCMETFVHLDFESSFYASAIFVINSKTYSTRVSLR